MHPQPYGASLAAADTASLILVASEQNEKYIFFPSFTCLEFKYQLFHFKGPIF